MHNNNTSGTCLPELRSDSISRTLLGAQMHWAERHLWRSSTIASHVASSRFVGTSHERWELILK